MLDALVAETAQGVVRAFQLAGIMIVVGATCFTWRIAPAFDASRQFDRDVGMLARRRAVTTLRLAALALLLLLGARLVQQAAAFADSPAQWSGSVSLVLTQTTWGIGWFEQGAAILLVLAASGLGARRVGSQQWPLGAGALALATSPALAGHAISATHLVPLAVVSDALHVTAAGAWLGTLFMIVVATFPLGRSAHEGLMTDILARFSPVALVSASIVTASGVFAAWLHVGTIDALWTSGYGRTLLLKLAVLGAVVALGAYNWRIATPRMQATGSVALIRKSAVVELLLAAVLVAITAVLVATPLPGEG